MGSLAVVANASSNVSDQIAWMTIFRLPYVVEDECSMVRIAAYLAEHGDSTVMKDGQEIFDEARNVQGRSGSSFSLLSIKTCGMSAVMALGRPSQVNGCETYASKEERLVLLTQLGIMIPSER